MSMQSRFAFQGIVLMILSITSITANAFEYTCTIKNTLKINANGYFVKHGWAANYMNREFTVDSETGRVLRTTALKQRLNNGDENHSPMILGKNDPEMPLKIITVYEDRETYALLQISDNNTYSGRDRKPFFYLTDIGMILTGTCVNETGGMEQ